MSGIFSRLPAVTCSLLLVIAGSGTGSACPSAAAATEHPGSTDPSGRLPTSGQNRCYDTAREIPCPHHGEPYSGQDANYAGAPLSFADNGDGTITDRVTGLSWQKRDDGTTRNWAAAVSYCEKLALGGHDDWRLPSKKELITIIDYGRADPAVDPTFFPDTKRGWYWTATSRAVDPSYAWSIFSANGRIHGNHKSGGTPFASSGRIFGGLKSGDFYARCVRGGLP